VQRHVVVIGAGIVGLAAAHELQHWATAVSTRDPMPCWHWLTGVDEVIRTLFRERFPARNARTGAGNPRHHALPRRGPLTGVAS
jgi:hypothetical protein